MTEEQCKDELAKLFRVIHPPHSGHSPIWNSRQYIEIVTSQYDKCRPHISISRDELYDLAVQELSDRNLNIDALKRLRAMCDAW